MASATMDQTQFDFALKEYYTPEKVEELTYAKNPAWALLPEANDWEGDTLPVPVIIANPQGRSATFATAQANKQASQGYKFNLTRVQDYGLCNISNETLMASRNNRGAFLSAKTSEINGIIRQLTRSAAIAFFQGKSGVVGQIVAGETLTDNNITLARVSDVTNFELNQTIAFGPNIDGTSLRDSGDTSVITGINRSTGLITFADANLSTKITGIAAGDYLFVSGDATLKIAGAADWIPFTTPTSTPFFGVDRTADVNRLAGVRYDGSSDPIEEALIELAAQINIEGGSPDYCFINQRRYSDLLKDLGSRKRYEGVTAGKYGVISFRGVILDGPDGEIMVLPDRNVPSNRGWMFQLDTWMKHSLGDWPMVLNQGDGLEMLRISNADGVEARWGYYGNCYNRAPGWNGVVQLQT